jgi:hypothetical protein
MDKEMFGFYKNALMNDLCDEYKGLWRNASDDKNKLVQLAMRQQSCPYFATMCYNGRGLSKEYLLEQYNDYINGTILFDCDGVHGYTYGLFVDYKGDVIDLEVDVSHIMFCEGITINVQETKCPIIYISNKSDVNVCCSGYNNVQIYLFDESRVTISEADEDCTIVVLRYSDKCKVEQGKFCLTDKVKVHDKELRL